MIQVELKKHRHIIDAGFAHSHMEVADIADNPGNKIVGAEVGFDKKLKKGIHHLNDDRVN